MDLPELRSKMLSENTRYIIIGSVNTAVGYFIGILAYKILLFPLGIWMVGLVANIFSISFSFVTYKLLVFQTPGNWLREYLKCYVVYGTTALVGTALLWLFVERLNITIWISQGLIIGITVMLSYLGHKEITFKSKG